MPESDPLDRLPHAGPARLPDRVLEWAPGVRVVAQRRLGPGDSCLNQAGHLPSLLLVELMAQVGGLLIEENGASGRRTGPGLALLAGIKRMHLHDAPRAGETVIVEGALVRRLGDVYLIAVSCHTAGRPLAHGRIQIRRAGGSIA